MASMNTISNNNNNNSNNKFAGKSRQKRGFFYIRRELSQYNFALKIDQKRIVKKLF